MVHVEMEFVNNFGGKLTPQMGFSGAATWSQKEQLTNKAHNGTSESGILFADHLSSEKSDAT